MRRVVPTVYGFVPPPMRVYPTAFPSQMSSTMTIRRMSQTIETATSIGSTSEGDDGSVNVDSGKDADASDDGRKERSVMNENESSSDTDDATDNQQSPQPENQRNLEIKKARSVLPVLPDPSEFPDWAYEPRSFFRFEILHESSKSRARVGRIHTPHGIIDTPGFVAVATNAALKGVDFRDADKAGQQLIFANTYHLLLQPGSETIREAGGIHKYTGRTDRPFITDSGGFQVFSLAYGSVQEELSSKGEKKTSSSAGKHDNAGKPDQPKGELKRAGGPRVKARWRNDVMGENAVKVSENGVTFRSYRDGSKFLLTPESTVLAQKDIGADIIIPLDELPPYHIDRDLLSESVDRYVTTIVSGFLSHKTTRTSRNFRSLCLSVLLSLIECISIRVNAYLTFYPPGLIDGKLGVSSNISRMFGSRQCIASFMAVSTVNSGREVWTI